MPDRIMVVNDTQEILDLFEDLLTSEGYEVVLYSYALRDLDEVKQAKPDLIVLDYIFGGEREGWNLLQKLKMRRETEHIPVVICTAAKRQVEEIEGHLTAMGVGVVLKPFNVDELLKTIQQMLQSHRKSSVIDAEKLDSDS
ncbi:MAG TPA: response regulator [Herpetosiphonaceae bacterium]